MFGSKIFIVFLSAIEYDSFVARFITVILIHNVICAFQLKCNELESKNLQNVLMKFIHYRCADIVRNLIISNRSKMKSLILI